MVASLARPVSKLLEQLITASPQESAKIAADIIKKTPKSKLELAHREIAKAQSKAEIARIPRRIHRQGIEEGPIGAGAGVPGDPLFKGSPIDPAPIPAHSPLQGYRTRSKSDIQEQEWQEVGPGPAAMTEAGGPVTSPLDEAVRARQDYEGRSSLIPGFDPAIAGTVIEEGPSAGHVRGGRTLSRVETAQGIDKRVAEIMEDNPATTIEEAESIAIAQMEADAAARGVVPSFAGKGTWARADAQALRTQKSARRAGSAVAQPFDEPPLATRINEAEAPVSRAEGENIPEAFTGRGIQSANIQTRDPIRPSEIKSGKGIERIAPGVGGQELGPANTRELEKEIRAANLDRPGQEFGGPTETDFGADTMHLVDDPGIGRDVSKYSRTGHGDIETEFGAEGSPELVSRISQGQNLDDIARIRSLKRDVKELRRRGESEEAAKKIMEPKVAAAIGYREVNATIQNFYRDWKEFVNSIRKQSEELFEKNEKFFASFKKMIDTTAAVSRKEGRLDAVRSIDGKAQPTMQSLMDRFYATVQGREEFNVFGREGQGSLRDSAGNLVFPQAEPRLASAMGDRIGPEGMAARALESGARDRSKLRQQAAGIGELEPRTMYPETLRSAAGKFSPLKQTLVNRLSRQQRFGIPSSSPVQSAGPRPVRTGQNLSQEDMVMEALQQILQGNRKWLKIKSLQL